MATSHLLATSASTIESSRPDLDPPRRRSARLAHLCHVTTNAEVRDRFEPVLTLAELADYLHVPVQTLYDLRAKGRGPRGFRVGRCLHFRKSEIEAWLAGLEDEDDRQEPAGSRP
jgi:excisionase family DNA binding protein